MRQHERGRDGAERARLVRIVQRTALLVGVVATTLLGVRIYDVQHGPPVVLDEAHRARRSRPRGQEGDPNNPLEFV